MIRGLSFVFLLATLFFWFQKKGKLCFGSFSLFLLMDMVQASISSNWKMFGLWFLVLLLVCILYKKGVWNRWGKFQ